MKMILAMTLTLLLFTAASSAQAAFRCQASNNRGHAWFAVAPTQWEARTAAIRACRANPHRHSCKIDYCRYVHGRRYFDDRRYDRHHDGYRYERRHRDDGIRIDLR